MDLHVQGNEMDLINSRFIKEPFVKIERCLNAYDFFPVQMQRLIDLQRLFKGSKILSEKHFSVDFLIEILPPKGVVRAEMLYSHTEIMKLAKIEFKRFEVLEAQKAKKQNQRSILQ